MLIKRNLLWLYLAFNILLQKLDIFAYDVPDSLKQFGVSPSSLEVLSEIQELGFILIRNSSIVFYISPEANHYTQNEDRGTTTLNYLLEYLRYHPTFEGYYYLCFYDAWREYSPYIPHSQRIYIPWSSFSKEMKQQYIGQGSIGEPRFRHHPEYPTLYPILPHKVLSYNRHPDDTEALLIPDEQFLASKGFELLRQEIDSVDISWNQKSDYPMIWRGNRHVTYLDHLFPPKNSSLGNTVIQRDHYCNQYECIINSIEGYPIIQPRDEAVITTYKNCSSHYYSLPSTSNNIKSDIDTQGNTVSTDPQHIQNSTTTTTTTTTTTATTTTCYLDAQYARMSKQEMLVYKYLLDIDGRVTSWSGVFWKLYSQSLLFKYQPIYNTTTTITQSMMSSTASSTTTITTTTTTTNSSPGEKLDRTSNIQKNRLLSSSVSSIVHVYTPRWESVYTAILTPYGDYIPITHLNEIATWMKYCNKYPIDCETVAMQGRKKAQTLTYQYFIENYIIS